LDGVICGRQGGCFGSIEYAKPTWLGRCRSLAMSTRLRAGSPTSSTRP